jgi:hypothetical protein
MLRVPIPLEKSCSKAVKMLPWTVLSSTILLNCDNSIKSDLAFALFQQARIELFRLLNGQKLLF